MVLFVLFSGTAVTSTRVVAFSGPGSWTAGLVLLRYVPQSVIQQQLDGAGSAVG